MRTPGNLNAPWRHPPAARWWLSIAALCLALGLAGCAPQGGDDASAGGGTGGITASAVWPGATHQGAGQDFRAPETAPASVATMQFVITAPDITTITQSFAASLGTGSVGSVPVGTNRTLTMNALNSGGTVLYTGSVSSISVTANTTTNAGTVAMQVATGQSLTPWQPTGVAASTGSSGISVTWDSVTGATSYTVYRATFAGATTSSSTRLQSGITGTSYTDSTALSGSTYYYLVTATNFVGESIASSQAHATALAASTATWTWKSGSSTAAATGVYGTKGTASTSNVPGSRFDGVSWTDGAGVLWMFGGASGAVSSQSYWNDLWKWDGVNWTWMSGSSTSGSTGIYGTKGSASSSNVPGARKLAVSWMDSSGNKWLFGGFGYSISSTANYLNDLWKYDGSNWTWVSGSNTGGAAGVYGSKGFASSTNVPGAREGSVSWIDSSGNLWLHGGFGYDSTGTLESLNDLWKFNGSTWTWVSGSNTGNARGVYGTLDFGSTSNVPGARVFATGWVDSSDDLWLYAGTGYDSAGTQGELNDLWKYDGSTWTWESGSSTADAAGSYGTLGTAGTSNVPGGRDSVISWIDGAGTAWIYGGFGHPGDSSSGYLSDLWKYDGSNWTWMSGGSGTGAAGAYGTKLTAGTKNAPGSRESPVWWLDRNVGLWLMGGYGYDSAGTINFLNDLWRFQSSPLVVPTSVTAVSSLSNRVTVSWSSVSNASSYNVYRSTSTGFAVSSNTKLINTSSTSYTDTSVSNGVTYYYRVTAASSTDESTASREVNATPSIAGTGPTSLAATGGSSLVTLTWTAVSSATGYTVYRSTTPGFTPSSSNQVLFPGVTTTINDTSVTNGTTYFYRMTATTSSGTTAASLQVSATPGSAGAGPALATPSIGTASVSLSWGSVSGASSYTIYRSTNSAFALTTSTKYGTSSTTSFTDSGINSGFTYFYRVTATVSGSATAASSQVSATLP